MRIQAIAVFERVVHQCHALSLDRPERPVLEVDASGNYNGNSSTLVVSNLTAGAALVAQAGANGAGIGGKSGVACGTVEIRELPQT